MDAQILDLFYTKLTAMGGDRTALEQDMYDILHQRAELRESKHKAERLKAGMTKKLKTLDSEF